MKRRDFLALSAATLALPRAGFASTELALGDAKIITLSDGNLVMPGDFSRPEMPADAVAAIRARYNLSTERTEPPCNLTLLRNGDQTILFDAGAGPDFMPTAGKLAEAMAAANLTPDDITHVVFTHAHPDHIWGLLDDFDEPVFTNAQYLMGRAEFDYWMDPDTVTSIDTARTTFAVGAARRLAVIADQITLIEDGAEVLPGVIARASFGHTPGHMSYVLHSGTAAALVAGDALGNHHIAFEHPTWHSGSDQDLDTGALTRLSLLDQITADGLHLIGFHLPGGGVGDVERNGETYRFIKG